MYDSATPKSMPIPRLALGKGSYLNWKTLETWRAAEYLLRKVSGFYDMGPARAAGCLAMVLASTARSLIAQQKYIYNRAIELSRDKCCA